MENISVGSLAEQSHHSSTETETETEDTESEVGTPVNQVPRISVHTLYNAAMMLRTELSLNTGMQVPWPPMSSDLNVKAAEAVVPISLYNMLAWTTGISDEPTLETYVDVPQNIHLKLLSLLQDVVFLQSKGTKTTPKSLCLGLTVRHLTGSTRVLGLLNKFGHCASHSTILAFETALAQFQLDRGQVYVPAGFQEKKNTILVWDNIDFAEETVSGSGTTHHTNGIMIQHGETRAGQITSRPSYKRKQRALSSVASSLVPYRRTSRQGPSPANPEVDVSKEGYIRQFHHANCLDLAYVCMKDIDQGSHNLPGWTGFNTILHDSDDLIKSAIAYLPVIEASPTEMDTVNTILTRSVEIADKLALANIAIVFDQAIYAKAQEIRWKTDSFKERLVIRLGEFHTSMSFLSVLGRRFRDAGLFDVLVEARVVAQGSVNAVLEGKQYNRAIRAHKLVFEAMQRLRFRAFLDSLSDVDRNKVIRYITNLIHTFPSPLFKDSCYSSEWAEIVTAYEAYVSQMSTVNSTFAFWSSYIEMVGLLLVFIRATRQSDWKLHIASVRSMLPWYFAYDRTHYSRYLPAYWVEMQNLPVTHPETYDHFVMSGEWTVQQQTRYGFSATACDQVIEQTCNRDSKTAGGISGITLNRKAVQRWILSQSERAAIARECEKMAGLHDDGRSRKDLDQTAQRQNETAVQSVIECIDQMINPFTSDRSELVSISSGVVAIPSVAKDLQDAQERGELALRGFFNDRIQSTKVGFHDPIPKMKLQTFSEQLKLKIRKSGKEITLQSDRKLFVRLLIIGRNSNINMKNVLSHSLGPVSFPLATTNGSLAKTNKAALLHYLEEHYGESKTEDIPTESTLIIDGMAMIHAIPVRTLPETFGQLAVQVLTKLVSQAKHYKHPRVDIVFDRYPENSIKFAEHIRRTSTSSAPHLRHIFSEDQKLPKQWESFLSDGKNKEALIEFLYICLCKCAAHQLAGIVFYVTHGDQCHRIIADHELGVVSQIVQDLSCDHEEADTRIALHCKHATRPGHSILVQSPDTDVAIILLAQASQIHSLFLSTGSKQHARVICITLLSTKIGPRLCAALPGIHVFSGCDSTSAFHGKGKVRPFTLVKESEAFQNYLINLGDQFTLSDHLASSLEEVVCSLYGQPGKNVDEARYKVFCMKSLCEQSLPPTSDSLRLHSARCNYQAAIHRRAMKQFIEAPSPVGHGWATGADGLEIQWMIKEPIPSELMEHISCKCKKSRCQNNRCSCYSRNISCTDLCGCCDCLNITATPPEQSLMDDQSDSDSDEDI